MPTDDEITLAGSEQDSDLDTMLVHNLLRTHARLVPLLELQLRRSDMTGAQLNALLALRAAGPAGLRMSEIGRRLVVTKSNVTGLVDRLERQGLVKRTTPADRRAIVVKLTPQGLAAIERSSAARGETLSRMTGCLSDRQKTTLIRLLTRLRRQLRQMKEGM